MLAHHDTAPLPAASKIRRPVAVMLSRFPLLTETFILREVLELRRQGQPVRVVPLLAEKAAVVHPETASLSNDVLYTPFLSLPILTANVQMLRRSPRRYATALGTALWGMRGSVALFFKTLALLPKAVYLGQQLESEGVRHIHAHYATHPTTVAYVISRLTSIGYSFTAHAHDIFMRRDFLAEKIDSARFVRLISEFNRRYLACHYPGLLGDKGRVVHMGVAFQRYRASVSGASDKRRPPRLLCVASLQPYKGHPVLLQACAELRELGCSFQCEIIGEGSQRGRLERQIARRGLQGHVRLLGERTQQEVAAHLELADLVVLPSVIAADGQMEGIPVTLMEAMASGKPVVAPNLSGIPELVEDGVTGLLFEPGNAGQLAAAVRWLLTEPALGQRLAQQGHSKVIREFRLDDTVAQLLALIDRENKPLVADQARFAEYARKAVNRPAAPLGLKRHHARPESEVFEVMVGGRPVQELIVKQHRVRPGDTDSLGHRARREFDALTRLKTIEELPAPEPLLLDAQQATIVMAACPGKPLSNLIRGVRWHLIAGSKLDSAFEKSGSWLGTFHRRSPTLRNGQACLGALLDRAHADLEVGRANGCLSDAAARAIDVHVDTLGETLDRSALWPVSCHRDFWPGNVFVTDTDIQVIDFEGVGPGLAFEDIGYFHIQARLFFPLMGARFRHLARTFLAAYGEAVGGRVHPVALALGRSAAALQVLCRSYLPAQGESQLVRHRRRVLCRLAMGHEA